MICNILCDLRVEKRVGNVESRGRVRQNPLYFIGQHRPLLVVAGLFLYQLLNQF